MLTASGHNYRTLKNNFSASFYINHGGNEDIISSGNSSPVLQRASPLRNAEMSRSSRLNDSSSILLKIV